MTDLTFTGLTEAPVINSDFNTWGNKIRDGWDHIHADLEMLNTAAGNSILGKNSSGSGQVMRLTGAQVTAMLSVATAAGGSAGAKGLAPAAPAGSQNRPLCGDQTYKRGIGRFAGGRCIRSGSTVSGGFNIASVTWTTSDSSYDLAVAFTTPAQNANYQVCILPQTDFPMSSGFADNPRIVAQSTSGFTVRTNYAHTAIQVSVFEG